MPEVSPARPRLFATPALIAMAVLAAVVLYVLHPREAFFDNIGQLEVPDALSLAYVSVLLNTDPDNAALRVRLANMQARVGRPESAIATLKPALTGAQVTPGAMQLRLELAVQQLAAATSEQARARQKGVLLSLVQRFVLVPTLHDEVRSILEPFMGWFTPEEKIDLIPLLAETANDEDWLWWQLVLGEAQVASGDPGAAAKTLASILPRFPGASRQSAANQLVNFYLASGQPDKALATFLSHDLMVPGAPGYRRGSELARLAGNDALEKRWLSALVDMEPNSLPDLRRLLLLQLGSGDLAGAGRTVDILAGLPEASGQDRIWAARVLEWRGEPDRALALWRRIYRETPESEALARVSVLAPELFRYPELEATLELALTRGQLDAKGYLLLAETRIRAIELEQAIDILAQGRQKFPGDERFVDQLYQLYVNTNRYAEAVELFESLPELSERQRLILANLYWRTRHIEQAIGVLSVPFTDSAVFAEAEVMKLDLLILQGEPGPIEQEYRQLVARDWQQYDPGVIDRLIGLAAQFADYDQVAALAEFRYRQSGGRRHLAILADALANRGRWQELGGVLSAWATDGGQPQDPRYWALKARLHEQRSELQAAESAYQQALMMNPASEEVLSAWGWLVLGQPGHSPDTLRAILNQLSGVPGQQQFALLAYGYRALGRNRLAKYWLEEMQQASEPGLSLADQADLAEHLGDTRAAFHLRKLAAREPGNELAQRTPSRVRDVTSRQDAPVLPQYLSYNRAMQLGWHQQQMAGQSIDEGYVAWDYSEERYRISGLLSAARGDDAGRFRQLPPTARDGQIEWTNNASDWLLTAGVGQKEAVTGSRFWSKLEAVFNPLHRWQLVLGDYRGERATDSYEAWWLLSKKRHSLALSYQLDSRTTFTGRYDRISFDSDDQGQIARGNVFTLSGVLQPWRSTPDWLLSAEYTQQDLTRLDALGDVMQSRFDTPLAPGELLTADYRRFSVASRWQQHNPHGLLAQGAQPGWFLDLRAGYVFSSSNAEFGLSGGVSWSLGGNDELALSAEYSSDSLDGDARVGGRLTYTRFFSGFRR